VRRLMLPLFAALALSGCAGMLPALIGAAGSPAKVADKTVLDEKTGLAVETLYSAAARAGALAFRAHVVEPSSNPAVQSDSFCALVNAKAFEPTDSGSAVMAIECKLRSARDAARRAYDAGNATTYDQATREAVALGREMLALIRGN
jgi:hypothetical protein